MSTVSGPERTLALVILARTCEVLWINSRVCVCVWRWWGGGEEIASKGLPRLVRGHGKKISEQIILALFFFLLNYLKNSNPPSFRV